MWKPTYFFVLKLILEEQTTFFLEKVYIGSIVRVFECKSVNTPMEM